MGKIFYKISGKTGLKKFFLCLAALVILSGQALAHGGGLDGYGGHHNRKQGGYHFHKGPLAGHSFSSKAEALDALNKSGARETPPPQTQPKDSTDQSESPRE